MEIFFLVHATFTLVHRRLGIVAHALCHRSKIIDQGHIPLRLTIMSSVAAAPSV
jgi:hypothetical protein